MGLDWGNVARLAGNVVATWKPIRQSGRNPGVTILFKGLGKGVEGLVLTLWRVGWLMGQG